VVDTDIEIGASAAIPKGYIPSDLRRMQAYRRISQAESYEDLEKVRQNLVDAYGELPTRTTTLINLAELRIRATNLGIRSITVHENDVIFRMREPDEVVSLMSEAKGKIVVLPAEKNPQFKEIYYRPPSSYLEPTSLIRVLRHRLITQAPAASHATQAASTR
jgi:transcription-repair coupling factor (superfamily II helicase)